MSLRSPLVHGLPDEPAREGHPRHPLCQFVEGLSNRQAADAVRVALSAWAGTAGQIAPLLCLKRTLSGGTSPREQRPTISELGSTL